MGISPVVLYSAVCDDVGRFQSSDPFPSYKQFASSYLIDSVIRKWIPEDTKSADDAAYDSFMSANRRCKDWKFSPERWSDHQLFDQMIDILDDFFHPSGELLVSSYFDILMSGRPGPGVSVGGLGTSYYTKYFSSTLASTSPYLYDEYRRYGNWIPFLSDAECLRYEKFGYPNIVDGSRCSFVPKTTKSSRMICIEPSVNMYYQLGLATLLEARLKSFFRIDLSSQPQVNSRLAQLGSIDGSYATIDLSSASDSVSLRLCDMVLPKWFFELLLHTRSRVAEVRSQRVPLFMLSTMGNGFTFPMQTIIFSSIVMACNINLGVDALDFSVFGDDIVCRREVYDQAIRLLKLLNFEANPSKTFKEGPFRESCGSDWFNGQPVRPVFIKKLDTPFDIMVAINQLNDWTAYTGIPLRNSVELLFNSLGRKFRTFVPFEANQDSGIRVPLTFFNPRHNGNNSYLYKRWERIPAYIKIVEGAVHGPSGFRKDIHFNPSGLYCSFLFGEMVNCKIMTRHSLRSYKTKLVCTPRWDYIPTGSLTNGVRLSWQQWETAVVVNLPTP